MRIGNIHNAYIVILISNIHIAAHILCYASNKYIINIVRNLIYYHIVHIKLNMKKKIKIKKHKNNMTFK